MSYNYKPFPRFAFRKEYFGGLILDYVNTTHELISLEEFNFLERVFDSKDFSLCDHQNPKLTKFIKKLQKKNILRIDCQKKLSVSNIRKIPAPKNIPKDYLSAPLKVFDTYTRKCNLICKHCYAASSPRFFENRRTLSQTKAIIKKFYKVGVLEWRFTGGEPTIHRDLFDAIKLASRLGIKVSLNTNGCWDQKILNKLIHSGLREIIISLEGSERINDKQRGSGAFKKVIKNLDRIYEYNKSKPGNELKVAINTTISKYNLSEIGFLVRLATKYGCNINLIPTNPGGRASKNLANRILSKKEYMEFARAVQYLREDPEIKESGIKIGLNHKDLFCPNYPDKSIFPYPFNYSECSALTTAIDILPDGRVVACSFLMNNLEFIGPNILDVSVYDAWQHPTMERFRRAQKQNCSNCKFYMRQCRGICRSIVLLSGGKIKRNKLIGEDPYCFKDLL